MKRLATVAFVLLAWPLAPQQGVEWDLLHERWNNVARTGNALRDKLQLGIFDVALAKKFSKQFRELERCGMWPREE
jgi:hypothetical protein